MFFYLQITREKVHRKKEQICLSISTLSEVYFHSTTEWSKWRVDAQCISSSWQNYEITCQHESLFIIRNMYIKAKKDQKTKANISLHTKVNTSIRYYQDTTKLNYIPNSSNKGKFFCTFSKNVDSHGHIVMCGINYFEDGTEICIIYTW